MIIAFIAIIIIATAIVLAGYISHTKKRKRKERIESKRHQVAHDSYKTVTQEWSYNPVVLDNGTSFKVSEGEFGDTILNITVEGTSYTRGLPYLLNTRDYTTEELKKYDWVIEGILSIVERTEDKHYESERKGVTVRKSLLNNNRIVSIGEKSWKRK